MFSAKIVIVAVAFSAMSALVMGNSVVSAQETVPSVAPPSWQAQCGYKWRQYKATTGETGRASYNAFMHKSIAEGGCGAAAAKTRNDEAIRIYIDQHKPQTECGVECGPSYQEARGRKK